MLSPLLRRWRVVASSLALVSVAASAPPHRTLLVAGVADARSGAPLEDAEVVLPDLRRLAVTNWMGEARLPDVPPGEHRVRVRKIGYAPSEVRLRIEGDSAGPVFFLEPPVGGVASLDTVRVIGKRPAPPLPRGAPSAFGARRAMGIGRFLTDVELEREADRDFALTMDGRFPGLRRQIASDGHAYLAVMRSACGSAQPTPRFSPRRSPTVDADGGATMQSSCTADLGCPIRVYLDELEVTEDIDILRTWDLAAVEFYSAAQTPPQYRDARAGCGVMLLWSKR